MKWDIRTANIEVRNIFGAYKDFVMDIATHYAGTRLIEHVDLSELSPNIKLALSVIVKT